MLNTLTKKRNEQKKKKGFTLIELIIVIAIIAILIALAVPKFMSVTKDAKIKTDIANAKTIESAIITAKATDKLVLKNNSTEVDLTQLFQTVPQGKYTPGTFTATYDESKDEITVSLGAKTVLGNNPHGDYIQVVEKK